MTIDGIEDWLTLADPARYLTEIDKGMSQSVSKLRDRTKLMPAVSARTTGYAALGIPVDTGLTRQRIVAKKNAFLDYSDVADTDYSAHVHDGTSKMPARPFFQWLLTDFGGIEIVEDTMFRALTRIASPR